MFRKTILFLLVTLLLGSVSATAQTAPKYGHTNLGNLLDIMPDTKTAEATLKVIADKLSFKDDSLTKAFTAAYTEFEAKYNNGELTPVVAQQKQAELQKQQEDIQKFEQDAQQTIAAKRQELLKPILDKVEAAIKAVATENQYLMIFDSSSGVMLFANPTDDVTDLVKKKLGIQ